MIKPLLILPILTLAACAHPSMYVLQDDVEADVQRTFSGTVLSVEADGDFVLETNNQLLFVDMDDMKDDVELGDRITVTGLTDNDEDDNEAPELDATDISDWE